LIWNEEELAIDPANLPLREAVSAFKRTLVLQALAAMGGNRSRAAASLQIERTSLLRLIRELGITELPDANRGRPASRRKPLIRRNGAQQDRPLPVKNVP
jgi:Bacterial regulatory protein, Fis family